MFDQINQRLVTKFEETGSLKKQRKDRPNSGR